MKLSQDCTNFDVGNACLAFLNGMQIIGNMIERGQVDYGLVVNGEGSRHVVESTIKRLLDPGCDKKKYRDNFATLTLGSGAAAMVLCRSDLAPEGKGHKLVGGVSLAATEHVNLCRGNPEEMVTDASSLLMAGLDLANRTFQKAKRELAWTPASMQELIIHQVSEVHTTKLCEMLELDIDLVYRLYPEFGNIGPASIPVALSKSREAGRLTPGKRVGLLGIGSGLNCSMMEVVW
jgi:acyl-CoA:acyl-CoA alkyltransferase